MYEVAIPITGWMIYKVEADSIQEALKKVASGEYIEAEYDVDKNENTTEWKVEECDTK